MAGGMSFFWLVAAVVGALVVTLLKRKNNAAEVDNVGT